jgi:alanyl-tRNA synthetase
MTDRLYYQDSYLTEFRARVVDSSPDRLRVYLDRTAFYPSSGGQPFDTGRLGNIEVVEVIDEDERIGHVLRAPLAESEVEGRVDWNRRFDHMQQHTGQHLLSAVLLEAFAAPTVSFHLGAESCTIDVSRPLAEDQLRETERRANQVVFENRPVSISFQLSSEDLGLRKPTERSGLVRIISIQDLDRSACGGTHVRATGEIGPILIRGLDRIRGNQRIEFVCGMRAVRTARSDFTALSRIAQTFSAPLEGVAALVEAQREKLQEADRARRRLATELAQLRGRALYSETAPGPDGVRRVLRRLDSLSDDLRTESQAFTEGPQAVFLALGADPPSVLLAVSKDSGFHAGNLLKQALTAAGGRGGGSATAAQGSLPDQVGLDDFGAALLRELKFPPQPSSTQQSS